MDLSNKRSVCIVNEDGEELKHKALLFGNNAAWHCVLCGELNGDRTGDSDTVCQCCGKKYKILTAEGDSKRGAAVGVRALTMTAEDLAEQLTAMRERAVAKREKEAALHLFGIRYASEMDAAGIIPVQVAKIVEPEGHLDQEIGKGKKLARRVKIIKPL